MFSMKPSSPRSNRQKPARSGSADSFRPTNKTNLSLFFYPHLLILHATFHSFLSFFMKCTWIRCVHLLLFFSFFPLTVFSFIFSRPDFIFFIFSLTFSLVFLCLVTGSLFRTKKKSCGFVAFEPSKIKQRIACMRI